MTKIVKITQASGKYYWYRDMIGELFEVRECLMDHFDVLKYETLDGESIIDPADVEVIADNKEPASEFHYIADEALGGVEREYKEASSTSINTPTAIGDYVVWRNDGVSDSTPRKVTYAGKETVSVEEYKDGDRDTVYGFSRCSCHVLVKTGRVRIDGAFFKLDKRNAQVGDRVLVADDTDAYREYVLGAVLTVDDCDKGNDGRGVNVGGVHCGLFHREYLVLEPADSKSIGKLHVTVDVNTKALDLIANLSAHVVKLERRLADVEEQADSNKKDVVTLAEEATKSARMNNGSIFV